MRAPTNAYTISRVTCPSPRITGSIPNRCCLQTPARGIVDSEAHDMPSDVMPGSFYSNPRIDPPVNGSRVHETTIPVVKQASHD